MKKMSLLVVLVALVSMGCASSGPKVATAQAQGAPEWVMKGSGAFGGDKGKAFYGVASASNSSNMSLMRTAADNRARNEVAKTIQLYTASLMKDYQATTSAGTAGGTAEEQHIEQAVKTVTAMTLSGVEIVDHWQNAQSGEFFALARLDLNTVKDTFEKAKELNTQVKDYVRKNADNLHDKLDAEIAKTAPKAEAAK